MSPIHRLFAVYVRPHTPSFAAGVVFLFLTNFFTVSIPQELGHAIDHLSDGLALPNVINIAWMGLAIIVVRTMSRILFFNPGRDIEFSIRQDLFHHLLKLQPKFYATQIRGDIISRASNDITWTRIMIGFGGLQLANVGFALSLTSWKMLVISPTLTIAAIVPIAIGFVIVNVIIRKLYPLMRKNQEDLADISAHVLDSFQGVGTIQGFVAESVFEDQFKNKNQTWLHTFMKLAILRSVFTPLIALSGGIALVSIIWFGAPLVAEGSELSIGELVAFITLVGTLVPYMRSIGWMLSVWQRGKAALERIFEIMESDPELPEGPNPVDYTGGKGPSFKLKNLSFAYPDEPESMVLQNINLDIDGGTTVGIFGRTGSGKTTLIKLISRLYTADPDQLYANDVELRAIDIYAWRRGLSIAPQRPFLFSDSIRTNIAMSDGASAEDIQDAVDLASLNQDLSSMPDGLETLVGERGIMLSGGQRQRVALARALYHRGDLILLDDVLSAVDHENEARLVSSLDQLENENGNPTCLIVSNRVSAFRYADKIIVLDEGKLVGEGSHTELIAQPGPYRDAWKAQREDA